MIKIEKVSINGLEETIRGMRNPMNSWDESDSGICKGGDDGVGCKDCANQALCTHENVHSWQLGKADHELMMKLAAGGPVRAKYRRMITVYMDITAPLYWWKEFDTYKVGTVASSCSTMHKIRTKEFTLDDFSHEHLEDFYDYHDGITDSENASFFKSCMVGVVYSLNTARELYLETYHEKYWWQMIQLLPSSYNQKRTVMLNYEVLSNIYQYRRKHRLDEWRKFCRWIEKLPYSEIITCNVREEK